MEILVSNNPFTSQARRDRESKSKELKTADFDEISNTVIDFKAYSVVEDSTDSEDSDSDEDHEGGTKVPPDKPSVDTAQNVEIKLTKLMKTITRTRKQVRGHPLLG